MRGQNEYRLTEANDAYRFALNVMDAFMLARPDGIGPTNQEIIARYWQELKDAAAQGATEKEMDEIRLSGKYKDALDNRDALAAEMLHARRNSLKPTDHLMYTDKTKRLDPWARFLDEKNFDRSHATTIEEKLEVERNYQELAQRDALEAQKEQQQRDALRERLRIQRERGVFGEDAYIGDDGEIHGRRHEFSSDDIESAERRMRDEGYNAIDDPGLPEFETTEEEDAAREILEKHSKEEREGYYESGD